MSSRSPSTVSSAVRRIARGSTRRPRTVNRLRAGRRERFSEPDSCVFCSGIRQAGPKARALRAHARAISGEMHSGFANLRSALPMNLKAHYPGFKVWAGAQGDIERVIAIWRDCLATYGGPYLFGALSAADAMYAPVCTRFLTYDVQLDSDCTDYCARIMGWPAMAEWVAAAREEPEEIEELDMEF